MYRSRQQRRLTAGVSVALSAALFAWAGARSAVAQTYSITPIGEYNDAVTEVAGISNGGIVAGNRRVSPGDNAIGVPWRYSLSSRVMEPLGTYGGWQGGANKINDAGYVVGWTTNSALVQKAAFWDSSGVPDALGSGRFSYNLTGLNDNDPPIITATASVRNVGPTPYCYKNGKWITLPVLLDGGEGEARAVNDSGVIVGFCEVGNNRSNLYHAVRWIPGSRGYTVEDLTARYGLPQPTSGVILINDQGTIASGNMILTSAGVVTIAAPEGTNGTSVLVSALNNNGHVVGRYRDSRDSTYVPRLFYFNGTTTNNLSAYEPSGWTLTTATGLNDFGQIVGMGKYLVNGIGQNRAYLMTPAGF